MISIWPRRGVLVLAMVGAWMHAPARAQSSVDTCRDLRHSAPAEALPVCRQALEKAESADQRFELYMHLSEIELATGSPQRAQQWLDQALAGIAQVEDPLAPQRLARRRGMLAFRANDHREALARFLEGLAAARAVEDARAIAISHNDLGVVYRRMGDDRQALAHWLESLELKQQAGDTDLAATWDNLGNLYSDLGEAQRAREFLERALAGHEQRDRVLPAAHTRESLGLLAERDGQIELAREQLAQALAVFESREAAHDQTRVCLHLAELEFAQSRHAVAAGWLERAQGLLVTAGKPLPERGELLAARLDAAAGRTEAAWSRVRALLGILAESAHEHRAEAHAALAEWAQALGRPLEAIEHLKAAHAARLAQVMQRHDERMDGLRARLEVSELEQERRRLEQESLAQRLLLETRRRQLLVLGLIALALIAGLTLFYQRRLYRQRLSAQAAESRHREQVEAARRIAESLRADLRSVQFALDESSGPVLVVDAAGRVRAANASAAQRLGRPASELRDRTLAELFSAETAARVQAALERAAEGETGSGALELDLTGAEHSVQALPLRLEEEFGVLALDPGSGAPEWVARMNQAQQQRDREQMPAAQVEPTELEAVGGDLRADLVALMRACLDAWERSTRTTPLELAERSGIWRITIDDGRLRTRTLNRYLDVETLPARPRWREVLRTAYFVLSECALEAGQRSGIEAGIARVLAQARAN